MIIQPERGIRDVNNMFYDSEAARIERLNQAFFKDVDLTPDENAMLVWLCGWDWRTVENIISAFAKVR